jgi:putative pyruvate formate lyase activating enzyme
MLPKYRRKRAPAAHEASYLALHRAGILQERARQAWEMLSRCELCPRRCRVDRLQEKEGYCKTGATAKVYSFQLHHGEEPPISGTRGSGTIFFSGCTLRCLYCQNYRFSQEQEGTLAPAEQLSSMMLSLQEQGAHNLNLVTPTHVMPHILRALCLAAAQGLRLPLVYNTSGYERAEVLRLLEGIVDVYLPDIRYSGKEQAAAYSDAPEYPSANREALREMYRQRGIAKFDAEGIMMQGMIIRHLVLPHGISGTEETMRFIAEELSPDTHISLMSQYLPCHRAAARKELSRRITREEYRQAQEAMERHGLHLGWTQEAHGLKELAGFHITPNA